MDPLRDRNPRSVPAAPAFAVPAKVSRPTVPRRTAAPADPTRVNVPLAADRPAPVPPPDRLSDPVPLAPSVVLVAAEPDKVSDPVAEDGTETPALPVRVKEPDVDVGV